MGYYKREPEQTRAFASWLRKIAPAKGFDSQRKLAKAAKLNEATISRIWNAIQFPDVITLTKIATALDVDVKEAMLQAGYPVELVPEKKQTPKDFAGENIGEVATDTLTAHRELTDLLIVENEGEITFMGVPLTRQDILDVRHTIAMIMRQRLPAVIPIYPPRPMPDYSKIISIKDIDPDMVPLPEEFINLRGERINRYEIFQAEGHAKTDDEWRSTVINHKYHLPPKK